MKATLRKRPAPRSKLEKALATIPDAALPVSTQLADDNRDSVVVVLGMHRSGTSLLSNVLHYLGAEMADESDHVGPKNPGGFWERPDLVAMNDEVLAAIGRPVASPIHAAPFPAGWWRNKEVLAIKRRMREHVEGKLSQVHGWWGFKDPRTCRLLPLWKELFDEIGIRPHYVWAIRSPGEASASMAIKNPAERPMSPEQAEVTWLAYNYDVLRYTMTLHPVVIEYGEWFQDPMAVGHRLLGRMNLPGFSTEQELSECIGRIVNSEFRNHVEGKGSATSSIPLAQTLFGELSEMARTGRTDFERMGRYIAMLEVTFRVMKPFVTLLSDMPLLRRRAREGEDAKGRVAALAVEVEELTSKLAARERDLGRAVSDAASAAATAESERHARVDVLRRLSLLNSEVETLRTAVAAEKEMVLAVNAAVAVEKAAAKRAVAAERQEVAAARAELAAEKEAVAAMEAAAPAERERAERLDADAKYLLAAQSTAEKQAVERIAALETKLAKSVEAQVQLRIACEGYLARIESLRKKGWLAGSSLLRSAGTKLDFTGVAGLKGSLDRTDEGGIGGWACWIERPTERVTLAFYEGERFLGSATADRLRGDLAKQGIGDGRFAFLLAMPKNFADGKPHRLDIRLASTAKSVLERPILVTLTPASKTT